jgi:branched-chain amino acid transport system substrate-binding protein
MTVALIAIASLVAPAGAASKGPAAGKTVHVGVIADVTGGAGVYGTPQKNAYDLANEDVKSGKLDAGGANLVFDVGDAATDPAQVVNLMQKYLTDGQTAIVLGPTLSGEAFKAFPLAARANFPAMGTSTTAEGVTAIGSMRWRNRRSSRRPSHARAQSGSTRPQRSSTGTTTRSRRPTATSSSASSKKPG